MTLPPSADVPLSASVEWKWKGVELQEGDRLELIPVKQVSNQSYQSDLVFTEVTTDQAGLYECAYTIKEDNNGEENTTIISATTTVTKELTVKGTYIQFYF